MHIYFLIMTNHLLSKFHVFCSCEQDIITLANYELYGHIG